MYLTQGLHRALQVRGNDTAIVFGDRRRSWRQLVDRVSRFANGLVALGVEQGERVAVLALNSDRYIETYFALPWMGAVVVPHNTRWTLHEHVYALQDSGATVLLVDRAFAGLIGPLSKEVPFKRIIFLDDGEAPEGTVSAEEIIGFSNPMNDLCPHSGQMAGIFYTGGTTGRSKGVMVSQAGVVASFFCQNAMVPFPQDLIYLHGPALFHMAGAQPLVGVTLMGGRHVVIPSFTPQTVIDAIQAERVTASMFVPTMFAMLRDHLAGRPARLDSMAHIFYGAAPISQALLVDAMGLFPNASFTQVYGQSEVGGCATLLEPRFHVSRDKDPTNRLRSAGRPICGIDVRVVDSDGGPCPIGQIGEIAIRSPGTMLGYWGQPDLTAQTVENGWVRTGDAAYMDEDGFLFIVDRVKDMIVSGGENVYSAEVENALSSHPAVGACAVIGVPDDKWGERVHAVVQLKAQQAASEQALIQHCKELIAGYKCPRSVEFRAEPLPTSGAGKILKTELRKPYWEDQTRQIG